MKTDLELQHISKSFDGLHVLEDVSLCLRPGNITALFGENGCGKTTLFHIISGFLNPDGGTITYGGQSLAGRNPVEISKMGLGRVWQTPRVCKNLTVMDNLLIAQRDHPGEQVLNYWWRMKEVWRTEIAAKEKAVALAMDIGLDGKLKKTAGALSFGQQKLLSVGMLLMNGVELLLMDEPFAGISPEMIDRLSATLELLKAQDKAVCIIEHNRAKALAIADEHYLLVRGRIINGN